MKTIVLLVLLYGIFPAQNSLAQNNDNAGSTFIGINPLHTIVIKTVSNAIDRDVTYLPVHLILDHSLTKHFGISGLLLYRLDKDGENFLTHELGFAAGPSYLSNALKGFYANFKIGFGYAFGKDYNDSEYDRFDLIIQPDIGYYINFKNGFVMTIGLGLQSLLKLSESYFGYIWEWNSTGRLSHYYLPVVNLSFGFNVNQ
jgi:hypothetical protein